MTTLHMQYQDTAGGSFADVDLSASRAGNFVLKVSDSHAMQLSFTVLQAQHTFPFGLRKFIKFWDSDGTTPPTGDPQSASNPLFEGWIWECQPTDSNQLSYIAYDPSFMSGREIPIMSTAWDASTGGSNPPQPGHGAVPRLILNSAIANDTDYAYERASRQSVANIIQMVLDDAIEPLRWYNAAPASGSAYINTEMAKFVYQPQEKVVSSNESIRAFIDRFTQQNYPEYAFLWTPGTRLWHWYSRFSAPAVTLTLNAVDDSNHVNTMELHRSLEGRYPAVTFYGPETAGPTEIYSTLDGKLAPIGPVKVIETYTDSNGMHEVNVYGAYQIINPAKRRGAKLLPSVALVRDDAYHWVGTRSPAFEISFDMGETFRAVESVWFDFQNGIINFPEGLYTYFWSDHELQAGSSEHFWAPNAFRVIWAPYGDPISVRYPPSGYAGSSFTIAGQKSELRIYDEMLAVGYNRIGIPVTTAERVAQYTELARSIWVTRGDILYAGGTSLEGLQYDFCRLNRCINLAAVDANGAPVITGWEGLNIILTDTEYNFSEGTTTLTFSQDALTALGENVDLLKRRLKIGYVQKIRVINAFVTYADDTSKFANKAVHFKRETGIVYNDYDLYYDPNLRTVSNALGGPQHDTRNTQGNLGAGMGVVDQPGGPWAGINTGSML
jgi:hypothetical protein